MIRHIFKLIWNERRSNLFLTLEYVLVFCILWFCCDYLYLTYQTYQKTDLDINNTYQVRLTQATADTSNEIGIVDIITKVMERIKSNPEVQYVAMGNRIVPYTTGGFWNEFEVNDDSLKYLSRVRNITSDFFNVFNLPLKSGRIFKWPEEMNDDIVILGEIGDGKFGSLTANSKPINTISTIYIDKKPFKVTGTAKRLVNTQNDNDGSIYTPLKLSDINNLYNTQIVLRTKPGTKKGFPERFLKDMREQLSIGNYYLADVIPIKDIKERTERVNGLTNKMNGVYSIGVFLVINIFLGILGTFWFRTQARRSQIGLRIALGASKPNVRRMMVTETLLLLAIAILIGSLICLNINQTGFMEKFGIPTVNREKWGITGKQDVINFLMTAGFLVLVSVVAVWYPARQASETMPAEVLKEE